MEFLRQCDFSSFSHFIRTLKYKGFHVIEVNEVTYDNVNMNGHKHKRCAFSVWVSTEYCHVIDVIRNKAVLVIQLLFLKH